MMRNTVKRSSRYSEHPSAMGEFWSGTSLEQWETVTLTIDRFEFEELRNNDGGGTEEKVVVYFKEDPRGLTLSKTRGAALVKAFGDDMTDWIDKKVELFIVETGMGPGIRVRAAAKNKTKPSASAHDRDGDRPTKKAKRPDPDVGHEEDEIDEDAVEDDRRDREHQKYAREAKAEARKAMKQRQADGDDQFDDELADDE
jgi:hypothetical protein